MRHNTICQQSKSITFTNSMNAIHWFKHSSRFTDCNWMIVTIYFNLYYKYNRYFINFWFSYFVYSRCECPSGYEGIRCEINVDDCVGHTCKNNATCIDLIGSYECSCARGFTGGMCETKIAFCSGKNGDADGPCQNGGVCMDHFTHYTCKCKAGFAGENCTININDCVDHMCQVQLMKNLISIFEIDFMPV